jgi:hypothetical protein
VRGGGGGTAHRTFSSSLSCVRATGSIYLFIEGPALRHRQCAPVQARTRYHPGQAQSLSASRNQRCPGAAFQGQCVKGSQDSWTHTGRLYPPSGGKGVQASAATPPAGASQHGDLRRQPKTTQVNPSQAMECSFPWLLSVHPSRQPPPSDGRGGGPTRDAAAAGAWFRQNAFSIVLLPFPCPTFNRCSVVLHLLTSPNSEAPRPHYQHP